MHEWGLVGELSLFLLLRGRWIIWVSNCCNNKSSHNHSVFDLIIIIRPLNHAFRVIGTYEIAAGHPPRGVYKATTNVTMYHIPFSTLTQMEEENPAIVLRLYKVLAHVMARKEDSTIDQLSTMHNILSSPAHSKPMSRSAMRAFMEESRSRPGG